MVKISADSTCDLSPELLKRYDVAIQPLYIVRDDASLRDGVDIRPTDIFAHVEKTGKLLKTAAVSVEDYIELFRRRTADGSEVVHVTISAENRMQCVVLFFCKVTVAICTANIVKRYMRRCKFLRGIDADSNSVAGDEGFGKGV